MPGEYDGSLKFDTGLDNSGFDAGSDELLKAIENLTREVSGIGSTIQRAFSSSVSSIQGLAGASTTAYDQMAAGTEKAAAANESFASSAEKTRKTVEGNTGDTVSAFLEYEQRISGIEKTIDRLQAKSAKMNDMGASDSAWKSLQHDIYAVNEELKNYVEDIAKANNSGQLKTKHYDMLVTSAELAGKSIQNLSESTSTVGSALGGAFRGLSTGARGALASVKNLAAVSFKALVSGAKRAGSAVTTIAGGTKRAIVSMAKLTARMFSFGKSTKSAGISANVLVRSLTSFKRLLAERIKSTFISKIFNDATESLQSLALFSDSFNAAMSSIKNSSKETSANLAVTIANLVEVVEPLVTTVINALSTAIRYVNAFLAMLGGKTTMIVAKKQQDSYAQSLADTAEEAKEAKRQLAGFDELNILNDTSKNGSSSAENPANLEGDLFEEVPIDTTLPDRIRELLEQLRDLWNDGQYFDFGETLSKALNEITYAGDDWINNTFQPAAVEWASIIAELLNGLISGWDAEATGKLLADGLNALIDTANTFLEDFDGVKLGHRLGEMLNGLAKNWKSEEAAKALANGINTILDIAEGFLTSFDSLALGQSVGRAINTLFDTVDWDKLGRVFSGGFNTLVEMVYGTVSTLNWAKIGTSLATAVESLFNGVNYGLLSETVVQGINGVVVALQAFIDGLNPFEHARRFAEFLNNIVNGVDWRAMGEMLGDGLNVAIHFLLTAMREFDWIGLGKELANAVNGFISTVDWGDLGELLSSKFAAIIKTAAGFILNLDMKELANGFTSFAKRFCDGITDAITEIDWQQLGHTVADLLRGVDWVSVVESMANAFGAALGGLIGFLWGFLEDAIKDIGEYFSSKNQEYLEMGGNVAYGWLNGIVEALKDIGKWVYDHVFRPFIDAFKKAFGIASPSTVMEEQGGYIIAGLLNGIKAAWEKIKELVGQYASSIVEAFEKKVSGMLKAGGNLMNNLKSGLSNAWQNVRNNITNYSRAIVDTINNKMESMRNAGANLMNNLRSGFSSGWSSVSSALRNYGQSIWQAFQQHVSSMHTIGANLMQGLRNGIVDRWNSVVSDVRTIANNITQTLKNAFGVSSPSKIWAEIGGYLDEGLAKGIEGSQKDVLETTANLANAVSDDLRDKDYSLGDIGAQLDNGVVSAIDKMSDKVTGGFLALAERLQAIADNVTFQMPEIAAGTVVPARVAAASEAVGSSTGADASNEELISVMIQLVNNATSALVDAIQTYSGATINIDKNGLYQSVRDEHNRIARMNGQSELLI